jgi:hypothetical protein
VPLPRPGGEHEQQPRVLLGADLVALVRVEDRREAGTAADAAAVGVDRHLAVDHDKVRPLVDLVVLEALAGGQVDGDRPRLAARRVQDLRLVRLHVERAEVPVLHRGGSYP